MYPLETKTEIGYPWWSCYEKLITKRHTCTHGLVVHVKSKYSENHIIRCVYITHNSLLLTRTLDLYFSCLRVFSIIESISLLSYHKWPAVIWFYVHENE